jgi:MoaA/NifB/PqqE/SkfB family radical SAM enzyme
MKKITERIDNITNIPSEFRTLTPPCPPAVKIELMAACDFKCWFCATKDKLRKQKAMNFDLYAKLIKDMHKSGVKELGLFYLGESLLYPLLEEAILLAKEVGFEYVFLTTNGYAGNEGIFRRIFAAGLDSLKFSFNYKDRETCLATTGVDAFDKVIENIELAYRVREDMGAKIGLYASSVELRPGQRCEMIDALEIIKPYIDEHYFLPLYNQGGFIEDSELTNSVAGNPGRADALRDPVMCWSLFTSAHVTYDGLLSACCFDHDGRFTMGDLKRQSFMDAWHSKTFQELRKAHINDEVEGTPCATCLHRCNNAIDS